MVVRGNSCVGRPMACPNEVWAAGTAVRIHVERNNPALGLYHRLGFREIEDQGVYLLMERAPARDDTQSAPSS